jgi:hypothetical protein
MPRLTGFVFVGSAIFFAISTQAVAQVQIGAPGYPADSPRSALPATPPRPVSPRATDGPPRTYAPIPGPASTAPSTGPVDHPPYPVQPVPPQVQPVVPGPTPAWQTYESTAPSTPPLGQLPQRATISAFKIPAGLSLPVDQLFAELGSVPDSSVPLTPTTSYDLAYACYRRGLCSDAVVLANHGLEMCHDARLQLIKGVCLLHLGRDADAVRTAGDFRASLAHNQFFGLDAARERVNDPMRVRFDNIVEYQNTGH